MILSRRKIRAHPDEESGRVILPLLIPDLAAGHQNLEMIFGCHARQDTFAKGLRSARNLRHTDAVSFLLSRVNGDAPVRDRKATRVRLRRE
jgi:imidazolonepropionase-like amidohydrolase